jgi:DNA replicative helicase MCM subunit Mcm2 (Cdc46/Mcm family)
MKGNILILWGILLMICGWNGFAQLLSTHQVNCPLYIQIWGHQNNNTFHRYIEEAQWIVYTLEKGTLAIRVIPTTHKDIPMSLEWTLERCALIFVNWGICLIDKFDKMNDHIGTHFLTNNLSIGLVFKIFIYGIWSGWCVMPKE